MTKEVDLGIGNEGRMLRKADRRFQSAIDEFPVPDIDAAQRILPTAKQLYIKLGIEPQVGKSLAAGLERDLYQGTAHQQGAASEILVSLANVCNGLKNGGVKNKN